MVLAEFVDGALGFLHDRTYRKGREVREMDPLTVAKMFRGLCFPDFEGVVMDCNAVTKRTHLTIGSYGRKLGRLGQFPKARHQP
jgi:hypothetical protein